MGPGPSKHTTDLYYNIKILYLGVWIKLSYTVLQLPLEYIKTAILYF